MPGGSWGAPGAARPGLTVWHPPPPWEEKTCWFARAKGRFAPASQPLRVRTHTAHIRGIRIYELYVLCVCEYRYGRMYDTDMGHIYTHIYVHTYIHIYMGHIYYMCGTQIRGTYTTYTGYSYEAHRVTPSPRHTQPKHSMKQNRKTFIW